MSGIVTLEAPPDAQLTWTHPNNVNRRTKKPHTAAWHEPTSNLSRFLAVPKEVAMSIELKSSTAGQINKSPKNTLALSVHSRCNPVTCSPAVTGFVGRL